MEPKGTDFSLRLTRTQNALPGAYSAVASATKAFSRAVKSSCSDDPLKLRWGSGSVIANQATPKTSFKEARHLSTESTLFCAGSAGVSPASVETGTAGEAPALPGTGIQRQPGFS